MHKLSFSFSKPSFHGKFRILWKILIFDNKLVQLISKIICTLRTPMSIIHTKERTPRPVCCLFKLWLDDIQNNRYTIFIIVSYNALMSIRSIRYNDAIFLAGKLGWLVTLREQKVRIIGIIIVHDSFGLGWLRLLRFLDERLLRRVLTHRVVLRFMT